MNKKTYYYAFAVLVVIIAGVVWFTLYDNKTPGEADAVTTHPQGKLITGSDIETFSGTITAVDTGCFSDAVCSVTVDGKKIILEKGGRGMSPDIQVGHLIGVASIGDLEKTIGEHANVYATTTPEGDYSLYGNSKYYVEVLDLKS